MSKILFVVTGQSESGDSHGPVVFASWPTKETLKKLAHQWDGSESEDGPGDFGSYVHLEVTQTQLDPTPREPGTCALCSKLYVQCECEPGL